MEAHEQLNECKNSFTDFQFPFNYNDNKKNADQNVTFMNGKPMFCEVKKQFVIFLRKIKNQCSGAARISVLGEHFRGSAVGLVGEKILKISKEISWENCKNGLF